MRRSRALRLFGITLTCCLVGLAGCGHAETKAQAALIASGPPATPTLDQLKSATVTGVFDQAVTLVDGRYEGPPSAPGAMSRPTLILWEPAIVFGDVDGAPGNEAVAMLSSASGGSGEFVYVAVFGLRDGKLANLGTAEVGDRVKLQALWLQDGKVVMDVVEAGPAEPACCPTQLARKTYAFEDRVLRQASSEVLGKLTIASLAAHEWTLVSIDGHAVPGGVKPPSFKFEHGSISGFAGCNRFNARIEETAPGVIEIGPTAATRMACPGPEMDLEQTFLAQLDRVNGYTFLAGQLALTWTGMDGNGRMLFAK